MADNANLARRIHEAWNERNFDEIAEVTAADGTITIVGSGDTFEGPEGSRAYNTMWGRRVPGRQGHGGPGDRVGRLRSRRVHGRGTHTGTLATSMGEIQQPGRSLTLQLCDVMEFKEGKVQSQKTYFDTGS